MSLLVQDHYILYNLPEDYTKTKVLQLFVQYEISILCNFIGDDRCAYISFPYYYTNAYEIITHIRAKIESEGTSLIIKCATKLQINVHFGLEIFGLDTIFLLYSMYGEILDIIYKEYYCIVCYREITSIFKITQELELNGISGKLKKGNLTMSLTSHCKQKLRDINKVLESSLIIQSSATSTPVSTTPSFTNKDVKEASVELIALDSMVPRNYNRKLSKNVSAHLKEQDK